MKRDINLIPSAPLNRIHVMLITILISILLAALAILLPVQRRNRLAAESHRITEELADGEKLYSEYLSLDKYSTNLLKTIEILNKVNSRQGDISTLFEIMDDSISPCIELMDINISGNILGIKGTAPNDKIIADSVLKLQENEKILSVKIQEIFLDKRSLKRRFDLKCITLLNKLNMDDAFTEGQDSSQLDLGGGDN